MKRLLHYLMPNDWQDVETIDIKHYSSVNGQIETLSKKIIIQKSPSTGRHRKQVISIYP